MKSKKKTGSPRSKKNESAKTESLSAESTLSELKHEAETPSLEEQLVLCFKSWTINTAFVSATFATLLGLSMSFLMVVAYNIVERENTSKLSRGDKNGEDLDDIMYILSIGAWSVWAWVFAYLILFIVFMIPSNKTGYWILWIAYMMCGLVILVTASMAVAKLNSYSDKKEDSDAILSAKYVCTVTIFISAFYIFLVLTVGLTLLVGADTQAMKYLHQSDVKPSVDIDPKDKV
jgi:hypothetical protein